MEIASKNKLRNLQTVELYIGNKQIECVQQKGNTTEAKKKQAFHVPKNIFTNCLSNVPCIVIIKNREKLGERNRKSRELDKQGDHDHIPYFQFHRKSSVNFPVLRLKLSYDSADLMSPLSIFQIIGPLKRNYFYVHLYADQG